MNWTCTRCVVAVIGIVAPLAAAQEPTLEELSAGFAAKVLASAVFVSDRDVDEALENSVHPFLRLGGLSPDNLTSVEVDRARGEVRISVNDCQTRTARYFGQQGCVILPIGEDNVFFERITAASTLPDPAETPWPIGDLLSDQPLPDSIDAAAVKEAVDSVFAPSHHTAAFLVVHNGRIIAERYGEGATMHTPLESWSMGKSLTAILYGFLHRNDEQFDPFKPAPFPEWQNDARKAIQIADLFRMSSGLKFSSRSDPPETWDHPHPDHSLVYSGAINVFEFSLTRPAEHPPNTVGRYRNCDPLLIGLLIRREIERRGFNYHAYPQQKLFDRLGIRNIVLEVDPWGNYISTGFDYGSGRDWARLGMLMLQDGVWQGERLLPEGFVEFVTTPAPAWDKPRYGGLFWLNRAGEWNLPPTAYWMSGQGGQHVFIIPSHDLVVVRMGHQSGQFAYRGTLNKALGDIVEAVGKR